MTCSEAADTRRRSGNNVERSGETSLWCRGGKKHTNAWVTSNAILPLALVCTLAGRLQNAIKNHSMGSFCLGRCANARERGLGNTSGAGWPRPRGSGALNAPPPLCRTRPLHRIFVPHFLQPTISQINPTPWPPIVLFRSQRRFARLWLNPKASQRPPQRNKRPGSI
jgi:hypothetical protein